MFVKSADRSNQKTGPLCQNVMESTPQVVRKQGRVRGSSVRKPQGLGGDYQRSEIDILKFDIKDKDLQLVHLNRQCEKLSNLSKSILQLIVDLEGATSEEFLSEEQRAEMPAPHDLVIILRHAISKLIEIHEGLPARFESDFSQTAEEMMNELEEKRNCIETTRARRDSYLRELQRLERMADIARKEKDSLLRISEGLDESKKETDAHTRDENLVFKEKMDTLRQSMKTLRASIQAKQELSQKTKEPPLLPPKRLLDMIKEDAQLNRDLTELQARVDREIQDRQVTEEEVVFIKEEIQRAQSMVDKYKATLTKEKQTRADEINERLKSQIARQREEFEWSLKSQNKRNTELEKQRKDLKEGEKLIEQFLQSLEKQLAAQMYKLPTLAQVQKKNSSSNPQRSSIGRPIRIPDDPEMRIIRKAIRKIKGTRLVSQSAIMASKLHPST